MTTSKRDYHNTSYSMRDHKSEGYPSKYGYDDSRGKDKERDKEKEREREK